MKKSKLFLAITIIACGTFLVTGCGTNSKNDDKTKNGGNESAQKSKGNCDVFECIEKVKVETTYEEINEIIGFEGKVIDESKEDSYFKYKKYEWELTDDTSITVRLDENKGKFTAQIDANFPDKMIKNSKVDFSKTDDMKKKINSDDGLTYKEFVKLVGGVEGTLDNVTSSSRKYLWVNSKGGSLHASFNNDEKCTFFNGLF